MPLHFTEELIVKRAEWGAKDSAGPLQTLRLPVDEILLTYTGTKICTTSEECRQHARDLQAEYQRHNMHDIGPNFMIGGDGLVYEGRGWNFVPEQHPCATQLHGRALEISHFGTKGDYPPIDNAFAAWDLIVLGIRKRHIVNVPNYTACYDRDAEDLLVLDNKSELPSVQSESIEPPIEPPSIEPSSVEPPSLEEKPVEID